MNNQPTKEIYEHLDKIPWFDKVWTEKELFDFLNDKKNVLLSSVSTELADVLSAKKSIEDMTEEERIDITKKKKFYEPFMLVDENDEIIRDEKGLPMIEFRWNCHKTENKEVNIHRVSDFLVVNEKGEMLLGSRSAGQDNYSGYVSILWWHCALSWYEEALKKELWEELGINLDKCSYKKLKKYRYTSPTESQFTSMYQVTVDSKASFEIDVTELDEVKWYGADELLTLILDWKITIVPHEQKLLLEYIRDGKLNEIDVDFEDLIQKSEEEMDKKWVSIKL